MGSFEEAVEAYSKASEMAEERGETGVLMVCTNSSQFIPLNHLPHMILYCFEKRVNCCIGVARGNLVVSSRMQKMAHFAAVGYSGGAVAGTL